MRFVMMGAGAIGGVVKSYPMDWFNGEIIRLGDAHGVPTPHSRLLLELITDMARARELPGQYTARDLRARLSR